MDGSDFGINIDNKSIDTRDTVRRFYPCDICKKEFAIFIPKKSDNRDANGLLILTDTHQCSHTDRYMNLYVDDDFEIRSIETLKLATFSEGSLAPLPSGLRRIFLENIPAIDSLKVKIHNQSENYEIVIGRDFDHSKNKELVFQDDYGKVSCIINSEYLDLDESDIKWMKHVLKYILKSNPSLEEILGALSYRSPSGGSLHYDSWIVSIELCSYCMLKMSALP